MKQAAVLPSGVQGWNKNVLDSGGNRFVYCSTLAAYTHGLDDYELQRIHTSHNRTITGVTWCRSNASYFTTCGVDNRLVKWEIGQDTPIAECSTPDKPVMVDWCGSSESLVACLIKPGTVYLWDTDNQQSPLRQLEAMPATGMVCLRWNHPSEKAVLAAGHYTGVVYLWNKEQGSVEQIQPSEFVQGCVVTDMQWDPLSNNYLLVTYSNGFMSLIDVETMTIQTTYTSGEVPQMSSFLPTMPGCFATISSRAAVLSIWSVAQSEPIERIKLKRDTGLVAIKVAADPSKLLLAFVDGCVGVFSLSQRKIVYCTEAGHSETIYDCRFSPASPDVLATASYDGTIKLWDILTQRCTLELRNRENPSALYSLAWGKGEDGSKLLASSSSGCIFMWDTITGALVQTFRHHQKPVFKVSWRGDKIASSSSDCTCVVFDSSGSILHKFAHPNAVYGCDWNPFNPNLLATGCHDGIIRVFDVSQQIMTPIVKLEAHDARVFNVIWSPLVPGILASGSDDSTVRVWEVGDSTNDSKLLNTLEGHENNVRGLLWNPEVPWLLLSGSWDGTIKLWDTRKPTECIQTVYSHLADVYGLDVHPERPFSIVSSSRDTSLRFWSLDSELFSRIKLQIILQGGKPDPMHTADAATGMLEDSPITMCGQAGHAMAKALQGINEDELQAYTKLFNFASSAPGMREFWSLVYSIDKEAASGLENSRYNLVHVNDLRALYKAKAEALQKKRFSIGNGRAADRLQEAALIHLKLGNVKEYCEIMRSIGEWERAIAVAPAVSPAYWQQLCRQRANELAAQGDDKALPYLMATGDVNHLTDFFGNDFQSALLVASGEATDKLPRPQEEEDAEAPAAEEARDDVFITDRIKHLTEQTAKQMLLRGKPIIAACYFLSIGDGMGAIKCLLQGNEVILALALCRVLKEDVDDVFRAAAAVSESLGMWHEALSFLQLLNDPTNELMLLLARFTGSTTETQDLYNKVGLQTQEGFQEQGEQQQKEGKTLDAVRSFMAARNFGAAADLGLGQIKDALGKADKVPPDMKELAEVAHVLNSADTGSVRAEILPEILIFSYYFGMRKAMDLGYYPVVPFLVKSIMFLCEKHGITPAFPISQLRIAEAQCCQLSDPKLALEIANELAEAKDTPANVKATAQALQRALGDPAAVAAAADPKKGGGAATPSEPIVVPARSRLILPPGCTLPSGNPDKFPVNSLLTGASIQVGSYILLDDKKTYMEEAEYLMWTAVTPFSPLHNGKRVRATAYTTN